MIFILLFFVGAYICFLAIFLYGFYNLKEVSEPSENGLGRTGFSIVVPFRNEEKNLPNLLVSFSEIYYSEELFEVIFVNDSSEDASEEIISSHIKDNGLTNYHILSNDFKSGSPKKDAIKKAVAFSQHEWIITTDADCVAPKKWLLLFDHLISAEKVEFIAGPVLIYDQNFNFISAYQTLESLAMTGVTMGSFGIDKPVMCNGANLAFNKTAFQKVGGYDGNDHIASGDDVFLLEKFVKKFPDKVAFLKNIEALVTTPTEKNWKDVFSQRIRWAAKAVAFKNWFSKLTGLLIFLVNLVVAAALIFLFISESWLILFGLIIIKSIFDEIFIYQVKRYFKMEIQTYYFRFIAVVYPFFTLYITLRALTGNYTWKGRKFKK